MQLEKADVNKDFQGTLNTSSPRPWPPPARTACQKAALVFPFKMGERATLVGEFQQRPLEDKKKKKGEGKKGGILMHF